MGLTRELVIGHPPQVPGVAGFPLGYHLGTDLVRAAALRWAGTDPWDSLTRLDVTLWALGLVLALRAVAARLGGPPLAVALAPWTLLFTDFSFVFAGNPQAHWWTDLLRGNLLLSLAYANPIVPALGLVLGAVVSLSRFQETGDRGHLALAALQSAAVPFFKVFLGAHLLLGLGVAWLLARQAPRRALLLAALPCALATAALALGQGGQTVERRPGAARPRPRDAGDAGPRRRSRGRGFSGGRRCGSRPPSACGSSRCRRRSGPFAARPPLPRSEPSRSPAGRSAFSFACPPPRSSRVRRSSTTRPISSSSPARCSGSSPRSPSPGFATSPLRRALALGRLPAPRHPGHVPVRGEEGHDPARSPPRRHGPRGPGARARLASRRRRDAAAGRALPARGRGPRRPARAVRALHALPHAVRLARRPRGPPRARLPLLPDDEPGGGAGDRALARRVLPRAVRERPRPVRHDRRARAGPRGGGGAGLSLFWGGCAAPPDPPLTPRE